MQTDKKNLIKFINANKGFKNYLGIFYFETKDKIEK